MNNVLIAGGGIGGLSAALACAREGAQVDLFERAPEFSEVGAGIQLSPNIVRVLHSWDLKNALEEVAVFPERIQIRAATTGEELGVLRLGAAFAQRYGAPYLTIERADMHQLLRKAVQSMPQVDCHLASKVLDFSQSEEGVSLRLADQRQAKGALLVGADGGWSGVRQLLLQDGVPKPTGHLAYRAMLSQSDLPVSLRSDQVTVWLGPRLHVVQYPVHAGERLNVVAIVHGQVQGDMSTWDHSANAADLQRSIFGSCSPLTDLIHAVDSWRLWPLSIRQPMQGAHEHASGRVALLGDAAHPMVPYLAQGAGMAIEDACVLAKVLALGGVFDATASVDRPAPNIPVLLSQYAHQRWHRNSRVQRRAIRNGRIFHATGPLRWGRDAAMQVLGESLLDMPWLYNGIGAPFLPALD